MATQLVIGNIWSIGSLGMLTSAYDTAATTIEIAIYELLANDGTVASLVSTRIYPERVSQGAAMPAITFQEISGIRNHTFDGAIALAEPRFQINCWDDNYLGARTLAEAVRKKLNGYSGTVGSVVIQAIHLQDEGDMPSVRAGTDVLKRCGKRLDFKIWFNEATS